MEFKIESICIYMLKDQLTITLSIVNFVLMTLLVSSYGQRVAASVTRSQGISEKKVCTDFLESSFYFVRNVGGGVVVVVLL